MFVCQCRAVTDRQISGAVAEGCTTLRSVAAATGAGTACGGCIATIRDLVCGTCPSLAVGLACDDVIEPSASTVATLPSGAAPAPRSQVGQPA